MKPVPSIPSTTSVTATPLTQVLIRSPRASTRYEFHSPDRKAFIASSLPSGFWSQPRRASS